MSVSSYVEAATSWSLGAYYIFSGSKEMIRWRAFVEAFVKWGYPRFWPLLTFSLKVVAGILVLLPKTRLIGLALAVFIALAGIGTLVYHDEPSYRKALVPGAIIFAFAAVSVLARYA